jgi:hypothetical protein
MPKRVMTNPPVAFDSPPSREISVADDRSSIASMAARSSTGGGGAKSAASSVSVSSRSSASTAVKDLHLSPQSEHNGEGYKGLSLKTPDSKSAEEIEKLMAESGSLAAHDAKMRELYGGRVPKGTVRVDVDKAGMIAPSVPGGGLGVGGSALKLSRVFDDNGEEIVVPPPPKPAAAPSSGGSSIFRSRSSSSAKLGGSPSGTTAVAAAAGASSPTTSNGHSGSSGSAELDPSYIAVSNALLNNRLTSRDEYHPAKASTAAAANGDGVAQLWKNTAEMEAAAQDMYNDEFDVDLHFSGPRSTSASISTTPQASIVNGLANINLDISSAFELVFGQPAGTNGADRKASSDEVDPDEDGAMRGSNIANALTDFIVSGASNVEDEFDSCKYPPTSSSTTTTTTAIPPPLDAVREEE